MGAPLGDYLIQSVVLLLALGALGALLLFAARRGGASRALGPVELLARLPLEARRSVYVVRIVDQVLIIGSSEAGLAKLGELSEAAAGELRAAPRAPSFAAVLAAARRSRGNEPEEQGNAAGGREAR